MGLYITHMCADALQQTPAIRIAGVAMIGICASFVTLMQAIHCLNVLLVAYQC